MPNKICLAVNYLPVYRRAIYTMIDKKYDCDWYVENTDTGVKSFSNSELKRVRKLDVINIGPFYWEKGLISLLWQNYNIYIMLGSTRNITLFVFCILKSLFYRKKKRIYYWTHGYYGKESKLELLFWKRPFFRLPDGLLTYGDYAKKIMVQDGFHEDTIYPIHNSLDYDTQLKLRKNLQRENPYLKYFGNSNPVIIFLGRLTIVKKLDLLVNALEILKNKGENYNLVFVGDGSEKERLMEMVEKKNLCQKVWFYGACYDESVNANLVSHADLCVAPGNIGLTAMHSLMFGCPAISHNNFALQMPEFEAIKPNKTGDFFEYGNLDSLVKTISNWFKNHKDDREVVREACYKEIDTRWNPYYQMEVVGAILNG